MHVPLGRRALVFASLAWALTANPVVSQSPYGVPDVSIADVQVVANPDSPGFYHCEAKGTVWMARDVKFIGTASWIEYPDGKRTIPASVISGTGGRVPSEPFHARRDLAGSAKGGQAGSYVFVARIEWESGGARHTVREKMRFKLP